MNKIYSSQAFIPIAITSLVGILSLFLDFCWTTGLTDLEDLCAIIFVVLFLSLCGALPTIIFSPIAYYLSNKIKIMPLFLNYISIWGIWLLATILIIFFSGIFTIALMSGSQTDVWEIPLVLFDIEAIGTFLFIFIIFVFPFFLLLPIIMTIIAMKDRKKSGEIV